MSNNANLRAAAGDNNAPSSLEPFTLATATAPATVPPPTVTSNVMGYHLLADVKHDFPKFPSHPGIPGGIPYYNIDGNAASDRNGGKLGEDEVVKYFLDGSGNQYVVNAAAREKGRFHFAFPEKTASFSGWKAPQLYQGGNDNLGLIHDAGHFISLDLSCQNVITFGSILDPAYKPNGPGQQPIWYKPATNVLDISLNIFGFDSNVIRTLRVQDLNAGKVKSIFEIPNTTGTRTSEPYIAIDAINMKLLPTPTTPPTPLSLLEKDINNSKPSFSGFFTSPKKISEIQRILNEENFDKDPTLAGGEKSGAEKTSIFTNFCHLFYIAKTLGDASLVASAMPNIGGNVNPYCGLTDATVITDDRNDPGWRKWAGGVFNIRRPGALGLKTGDRLNWLRAILFNVPAIYETGGTIRSYKYFPGVADEADIRRAILEDLQRIPGIVERKYAELYTNLRGLIIEEAGTSASSLSSTGVTRKLRLSNFAPGGASEITATGQANAVKLIEDIQNALYNEGETQSLIKSVETATPDGNLQQFPTDLRPTPSVCERVLQWVNGNVNAAIRANTVNTETLRKFYLQVLERANACSPQTTDIVIKKTKGEPYLSSKLIVANVPLNEQFPQWPYLKSLDISLRNAFRKLNSGRERYEGPESQIIQGTDIYNRFFSRLSLGNEPIEDAAQVLARLRGEPFPPPAPAVSSTLGPGGMKGGMNGDNEGEDGMNLNYEGDPNARSATRALQKPENSTQLTFYDITWASKHYDDSIFTKIDDDPSPGFPENLDFESINLENYPCISDFATYIRNTIPSEPITNESILQDIYEIDVRRSRILDEVLFKPLYDEYQKVIEVLPPSTTIGSLASSSSMSSASSSAASSSSMSSAITSSALLSSSMMEQEEIQKKGTKRRGKSEDEENDEGSPKKKSGFTLVASNKSTILFNAYTYHINAINASSLVNGEDIENCGTETEAYQHFKEYEAEFLNLFRQEYIYQQPQITSTSYLPSSSKAVSSSASNASGSSTPRNPTQYSSFFGTPSSVRTGNPANFSQGRKESTLGTIAEDSDESSNGHSRYASSSIFHGNSANSTLDPSSQNQPSQAASMNEETGGLRTKRRHTYRKKHVQTSSTRTRSNARLRERTRARTTYRVRKHPGKSKPRRQRNNLDRV